MSETPHYRVEHPSMSGLQGYLNRAHESGFEVVSVSADGHSDFATLVLRAADSPVAKPEDVRRAHLLRYVRLLPDDVEGPAAMIKMLRHLLADMDALKDEMGLS